MSNRKTLKIDEAVYDQLADAKGSTDTWDEFLSRLVNSVEQGQVHFDRATLQDFDETDTSEITLHASSDGDLEIHFLDESGAQIGGSMLSVLDSEEEVVLRIETGERASE
ncbi:hypothetical protein [Halomicrobium salinisoli]|uniref:hypothetical protein n=1 Tax=Halomicrobium salinisoli TaxID=2878391 RepID=UPI001CF084EB|nr:hypothetical protein [Halomicrobium salinisoli]